MSHASCQHGAYRLTCEDYDALLARAGNACEICRTPAAETTRGTLIIDHDSRYSYAAVRGLLCDKCNHLMDRVDRGREFDPRTIAYCADAWFVAYLKRYVATPPRKSDS